MLPTWCDKGWKPDLCTRCSPQHGEHNGQSHLECVPSSAVRAALAGWLGKLDTADALLLRLWFGCGGCGKPKEACIKGDKACKELQELLRLLSAWILGRKLP